MLLLRQPQNVVNIDTFQKSAVKLSFGNEKVATDNYQKLKQLQQTIVQINAHHSSPKAKCLSSEDMGGLEPTIYLSKQARLKMENYQSPKKRMKYGMSSPPTSPPSSSSASFTGYVQQVNDNRKSGHGSNHYFDIYLQVSEESSQMIRVMTSGLDDTTKQQLFQNKQQAQQPITISNLRVVPSGMIFMHNNSVIKDTTSMSLPFKYAPPAALPVTTLAEVIKNKKQGDTITVSGTVKWDGEAKTPNNSNKKVRDGKIMDSSAVMDISIWENHIQEIKEGNFYKFTNCKVKHFFGKKLSTSPETVIEPADKQDVTQATQSTASLRPHLCCPDIQNVIIETNAICNTKGCRTKITGNTESKKMVRCTSCNRAMLINNCYMEINTTFQLETTDKQYTVMANQTTLSTYLGEDVYKYKDNVDDLTEKLLLLDNVDFKLSTIARMITEIVDHQQELQK
ncbi:unnamed protein product [Porites lobata]|uniref:Uncharacterized protein n=1 Tax=Porites lobata TaxID=104759 RepID=A0ABN8SA37_9CNID|nr:unnamed protein product [Porites lobata]